MLRRSEEYFREDCGVFIPEEAPGHRDEEYDPWTFELLLRMQRDHFWYRGRHKFLIEAVRSACASPESAGGRRRRLSAVDMGGGCGGWLEYLHMQAPNLFEELALSDSSRRALDLAGPVVGAFAARYHSDLLDLRWQDRWDVVFLLDVIEHIPEHVNVLRQVRQCLRPGGLLFVTTPALQFFWTYNDEFVRHQRRYSRRDFENLAQAADLRLKRCDYFMFFLSPALYVARKWGKPSQLTTEQEIRDHLARTHRIPPRPINALLEGVFSVEAWLSRYVTIPWGTSILGVFEKPRPAVLRDSVTEVPLAHGRVALDPTTSGPTTATTPTII